MAESKKKSASKKKAAAKKVETASNPMLDWLADKAGALQVVEVARQMAQHNGQTFDECCDLLAPLASGTRSSLAWQRQVISVAKLREFFS